jgi:hypothetical protein
MDMTGIMGVISYGLDTVIGFFLVGVLVCWFIQDVKQKKHTVLRNYPVIGRLRFFLAWTNTSINILIRRRWPRDHCSG